jgi:hypothetical protein
MFRADKPFIQSQTLAHLQSITIVFLKIILTNVSAVVNQANSQSSQNMRYGKLTQLNQRLF